MRRILLSTMKILISAALLYLALRKVNLVDSPPASSFASLGWIGAGDCRDLPADIHWRAEVARDQRGVRRAAPITAGDALQPDRNVLQPDAALLDRRRRGAAVAGGPQRRRLARSDLFHLRRPRHRPDRARGHHRREPALELPFDHRSPGPLGAACWSISQRLQAASDFCSSACCHGRG